MHYHINFFLYISPYKLTIPTIINLFSKTLKTITEIFGKYFIIINFDH
jgi:hypothetical protein